MEKLQNSAVKDLTVTIHHSSLVMAPGESKNTSVFLSNIDKVLDTINVQTVHFFRANPDFPPEVVAARLKIAIQKVMVPYDFLAGRLKVSRQSGRLEIECCNKSGVGFIVASTELGLEDMGDLVYPNPQYGNLVAQRLNGGEEGSPLCILQVTSFKCGGFALGITTNHALFDGLSFKTFLENLASQAFHHGNPLAVVPCNNRRLLAARLPPQVTFPHPELLKLNNPTAGATELSSNPSSYDKKIQTTNFKILKLSADDISHLKKNAKAGGSKKITGFNVVTAHIWRCKALSSDIENNRDRLSTILYAVDIRRRLNPPLPLSYSGNAVLIAYASAKCWELEEEPLFKIVDMVSDGAARISDEYARSVIDWGEIHDGFPHGEVLISSWWRLGFDEVVYPWGKPRYSCPVVHNRKDIILLFPEIRDGSNEGSVNILVALPAKELQVFERLFHKFLQE